MFFIAGITGHVGGAAARRLIVEGHKVRALVRNGEKAKGWAEKGVELVEGDLTDSTALASALEGVLGAFLMIPPLLKPSHGFPEANEIIDSFETALHKTPPPNAVFLSSIGSEKESGLGLITTTHLMEEALGNLPFPTAFIRAGGFIENNLPQLKQVAASGVFYSFYAPLDSPKQSVATVDIGNLVVKLLTSDWSGKRIIELGSPVSPNDIAAAFGEVLGKPVTAQAIPREQWTSTLQSAGMPAEGIPYYVEMIESGNSGWIDFGVPGTEKVAASTSAAEVVAEALKAENI
jgi:uncharacterized protein YbjT (DUF2867 family)